jgi:hypothetical protein
VRELWKETIRSLRFRDFFRNLFETDEKGETLRMKDFPPLGLAEDREEARKLFNALSPREQIVIALRNWGKKRLEILLLSDHPELLVQQLPAVEVFLTVKEVGERDAMDLIHLATVEQMTYIFDLDLWKGDEIDPERALLWFEILADCGEKRIQDFLEGADQDLLASLFRKFISVHKTEDMEVEIVDSHGQGLFTLDRIYFVEFTESRAAVPMKRILESLFAFDPNLYQTLMEAILWDIPAEEESLAFRWRNARLADEGFPGFDEAMEVYSYLPPERVKEGKNETIPSGERLSYPPVYVERTGQGSFFSLALQKGGDESTGERLRWEIVSLANRIMVADASPRADVEALYQSTEKAFRTLDLGLRYLSQDDPNEAAMVLKSIPLLRIFQTGFSLVLKLRRRAGALVAKGWLGALDRKEDILDSPLKETIKGLLRKRPLFFSVSDGGLYRPFERLEEIALAETHLERIEVLGKWVHESLGITDRDINQTSLMSVYLPDPPLSTLCLTVHANQVLHGEKVLTPIDAGDLERLYPSRIEEREGDGPHGGFRPGIRELLFQGLENGKGQGDVRWWVDFLANRVESFLGGMTSGQGIDPRFVDIFLIRK